MKLQKRLQRLPKIPVAITIVALVAIAGVITLALTRAATSTIVVNDSVIGTGANQWQYTGTNWAYFNDGGGKYQGDDHSSSAAGDYATLKFSGISASYYGAKSPQAGIVGVSVDNGTETMVDLYSATRIDNTPLFTTPTLTDGSHTLKIRLTGNKNASAIAAAAGVDRAVVTVNLGNATFSSLEAEDGNLALGAVAKTDSTASAGQAVNFQKPAVGGALPAKLLGAYWQMYQGPNVSEVTANAPEYNIQYAAFGLGNGSNGVVAFNPDFQSGTSLKNDIKASQAKGCKWLLSIGGGVPAEKQVFIRNQDEANQVVNSVIPIIDAYGFEGLDFDLENGPEGWSQGPMVSVAAQLKAHYGSKFIIQVVPRPYETFYYDTAIAMGNNVDIVGLQFYDNPSTQDAAWLRSWITGKVDEIVGRGIPASKIMIGCITYYPEYPKGGSNSVTVYRDIYNTVEAKYPTLRGAFVWESSLDKLKNWGFAETMGQAVLH